MKKDKVLVVCGVTGSGKSAYGMELGGKYQGEIINCDIAQCYSFLKIGSAAPSQKDCMQIPHHLYSFLDDATRHSAYMHRELIEGKSDELIQKNKLPIIVGGSHFYLWCLLFSKIKDNVTHYECHQNDAYRNERKKEEDSCGVLSFLPRYDYSFILKNSPPSQESIKKRIYEMIDMGWYDEAKNLSEDCNKFVLQKKIIGYEDILSLHRFKLNDIVEKITIKTNQYIKKQKCFIKKLKNSCLDNNIEWREID